ALKQGDITGNAALYASLYHESQRLLAIIQQLDQLKEWGHVSAHSFFSMTKADMADMVKQSAAMFEWTCRQAGIPFDIETVSKQMMIHVEGIQQVISNLIDNAVCYYEGDGPIKVEGKLRQSDY